MTDFDTYVDLIAEKGLEAVLAEANEKIAEQREKTRIEKELIKKYLNSLEDSSQNSL